jgi:hypothetical protein
MKYAPLPFHVDALILVGCPVGLFLTVRDVRLGNLKVPVPEGEEAFVARPVCNRIYNLFHPVCGTRAWCCTSHLTMITCHVTHAVSGITCMVLRGLHWPLWFDPVACRLRLTLLDLISPSQFDPVAYRLEPLIDKELTGRKPGLVYYHQGVNGLRLHNSVNQTVENLATKSNVCSEPSCYRATDGPPDDSLFSMRRC